MKMLEKYLQLKTTAGLPSVVSKNFENLVDNRSVDYLEKCGLFLYGFRSSQSTAVFLTVVSERIASWKFYGISGQVFGLILSFLCNRWL